VGKNWLPLSLIKYLGAIPAALMARPRQSRTSADVGGVRKSANP
jgi:hypothetical protein